MKATTVTPAPGKTYAQAAQIQTITVETHTDPLPQLPLLNPRPAGVFGRTRLAGGGGQILSPLPNSRTRGHSEADEAANERSR